MTNVVWLLITCSILGTREARSHMECKRRIPHNKYLNVDLSLSQAIITAIRWRGRYLANFSKSTCNNHENPTSVIQSINSNNNMAIYFFLITCMYDPSSPMCRTTLLPESLINLPSCWGLSSCSPLTAAIKSRALIKKHDMAVKEP